MLIVTNPPPKSDSWCYDFTYNIWMRLDLSDVLPNALFVVPSENCLTLFDSGMKNYVKATYNDINILKDRIVTHNLNSSLYKFEEEHFDENHKSVLNAQKTALVLLQSVVRNHTQVNESALFQLEIEHDENEIRQLQQSFKKTIKHEESKSKAPKLQKTAFELMEMIQNLKEKQKEESNEHNNNNLALLQTLRSYTFEGFNKTKEINEETLNYFIHMSEEMSKQITEQNQRINQLRKMIETQKNKYGNCLSSLIYAKEQLDLWNTNLNESKSQLSASISRYVDSQIEYNNSLLNEILYPNENTNKKRLLRHEASVLQRQHINHRRSKQAKLNQLNDEIKMLIKQGTSGGQKDGEIMCRQVKTRIIELVEWVNENARGVGSNKELKLNEDSNKGITPTSIRRKVPAMRTRVDSMGNYQNNIESDISSYSKSVILALEELKSLYNLTV